MTTAANGGHCLVFWKHEFIGLSQHAVYARINLYIRLIAERRSTKIFDVHLVSAVSIPESVAPRRIRSERSAPDRRPRSGR